MQTTALARARKVVVVSVAAGLVSLPLTLTSASSAAASTTRNGCTVTPLAPVRVGNTDAIRFPILVTCNRNRIVQIVQQRFESDSPAGLLGDDFLGSVTHRRTFAETDTIIVSSIREMPNTELGGEELFHRVTFRVVTVNGSTGFTTFERSVIRFFVN